MEKMGRRRREEVRSTSLTAVITVTEEQNDRSSHGSNLLSVFPNSLMAHTSIADNDLEVVIRRAE